MNGRLGMQVIYVCRPISTCSYGSYIHALSPSAGSGFPDLCLIWFPLRLSHLWKRNFSIVSQIRIRYIKIQQQQQSKGQGGVSSNGIGKMLPRNERQLVDRFYCRLKRRLVLFKQPASRNRYEIPGAVKRLVAGGIFVAGSCLALAGDRLLWVEAEDELVFGSSRFLRTISAAGHPAPESPS